MRRQLATSPVPLRGRGFRGVSTATKQIEAAIDQSCLRSEIVHIAEWTEALEDALLELAEDSVRVHATVETLEAWGARDGSEWRVHLHQSDG